MKIEEINKKQEFQPIELKITIESEKDLCDLWHRFNTSIYNVNKEGRGKLKFGAIRNQHVWRFIDNIVKSRGLKTNK